MIIWEEKTVGSKDGSTTTWSGQVGALDIIGALALVFASVYLAYKLASGVRALFSEWRSRR